MAKGSVYYGRVTFGFSSIVIVAFIDRGRGGGGVCRYTAGEYYLCNMLLLLWHCVVTVGSKRTTRVSLGEYLSHGPSSLVSPSPCCQTSCVGYNHNGIKTNDKELEQFTFLVFHSCVL